MFVSLVRARDFIDLNFHKVMKSLDVFIKLWCFNDVVCSLVEEDLVFHFVGVFFGKCFLMF